MAPSVCLAVIAMLVLAESVPAAEESDGQDITLRGLDGVTLLVAEPDSSFISRGITMGVIRAPVELALRESGIPVLNDGDQGSIDGNPTLMVTVTGVLDDAMQQYAAFLALGYCIFLVNDTEFQTEAINTAYTARFGAAMLDNRTLEIIAALP